MMTAMASCQSNMSNDVRPSDWSALSLNINLSDEVQKQKKFNPHTVVINIKSNYRNQNRFLNQNGNMFSSAFEHGGQLGFAFFRNQFVCQHHKDFHDSNLI